MGVNSTTKILEIVEQRFTALGTSLKEQGVVSKCSISKNGGVQLNLLCANDNRTVELSVSRTGEFFSRRFNKSYERFQTAYEEDAQLEALEDLLRAASHFLTEKGSETVWEKNGKAIFKTFNYESGGHESKSLAFLGRIRRHLGASKTLHQY